MPADDETDGRSTASSPLRGFARPTALDRADRRAGRRLPFNERLAVAFFEKGEVLSRPRRLIAEDISAGGVRLTSSTPFTPGAVGVVQLAKADGSFGLVGIVVVHARAIDDFTHTAGARFTALPRQVVVDHLVRPDGRLLGLDGMAASA